MLTPERWKLKCEAHRLLDILVNVYGFNRKKVYKRLAQHLGVDEQYAHFHGNWGQYSLNEAILYLYSLIKPKRAVEIRKLQGAIKHYINEHDKSLSMRSVSKAMRKRYKHEIFNDLDVIREVGRRNALNIRSDLSYPT